MSDWELTDTYSPAAIDIAPATSAAPAAVTTAVWDAPDATTPMAKLATDTMPSSAPSTTARSQPDRAPRWRSATAGAWLAASADEVTGVLDRWRMTSGNRSGSTMRGPRARCRIRPSLGTRCAL